MAARTPRPGWRAPWEAARCEASDTSPPGTPVVTWLLITVNTLMFLPSLAVFGLLGQRMPAPGESGFDLLLRVSSPTACVANLGCWGAAVASMFTHAGLLHLLGNMWFLYILGDNVELTLGRARFLAIYLASGLVGGLVESAISLGLKGPDAPPVAVGASAAISGAMGSYLMLYPGSTMCYCIGFRYAYYCMPARASNLFALWVGYQLLLPMFTPNIGVHAHLAGLLAGAALTLPLARGRERDIERLRKALWRGVHRGFRVEPDELARPSLTPLAIVVIVIAAAYLAGLAAAAAVNLAGFQGKYYGLYYCKEKGWRGREWYQGVILDHPPEPRRECVRLYGADIFGYNTPRALRGSGRLVQSVHLTRAAAGGAVSLALTVAAALGAFRAMRAREAVEVTYIPRPLLERLRRESREAKRRLSGA
ncbi:MAG: rhomboid family intramembrane serine protease [Desulfurococcales archaeon]|nr:rhomboid family intramembrane serine protease [Desulfurococcales archaeon]